MRKILINFLKTKIAPKAQRISDTNEELAQIESEYNETIDHASLVDSTRVEIEGLLKKISTIESDLRAIDTAPPVSVTPTRPSSSSKEAIEEPREGLTRLLSSMRSELEIKERQLQYHQKQLSFPGRKEELEALVKIEHENLLGQIDELNQLLLNGEKPSIFKWTRKLDLFTQSDGYGLMHYLAHYDVLQYVLPGMLENAAVIVNRELSGRFNEPQAKQAILQRLGEPDKSGLPPIQRALVNGSIGSFEFILELPNCKKGIFEVGPDRSNIFHQAMLQGVFQSLVPYIEDGLEQLVIDEEFVPRTGTARDHVKLMLTSENTKGYSPAKLAAYVASAPDFRYVFDSGVLKLNSGTTEQQLETYTASGRTISKTKASVTDLIRVGDKVITIPPEGANSSVAVSDVDTVEAKEDVDPVYQRIVQTPLTKEDQLLDFLFRGLSYLEPFVINLVDNGCVEIFDAILERQRTTKDFRLAKYIIQITEHVRHIKSLNADHPKFKEIISIYRKIFREYWPEITINDNNLKAHVQLKALAEEMDSHGGRVLGIPSDKLKDALGISESELALYNNDIFLAAQGKLFDQLAQSYESDVTAKAIVVDNPLLATPSPVKINVRKVVSSTVKRDALVDCPEVLEHISKTIEEVEAVPEPTARQRLAEVTGLNTRLRELDSPSGADGEDLVKIEISKHIELIFGLIVTLKDQPNNEDIKELYNEANPDAASPSDADVIKTVLLLATGMRVEPGLFLNFVNDATVDANGEEVTIETFMSELITHIGVARLAEHGCVNFEPEIAAIVIEALHGAGELTYNHLEYAMEVDNKGAIDIAMSTGTIKWEDALLLAFEMDNLKFLDRYVAITTLTALEIAEISKNLFPPMLDSLTTEALSIYEEAEDERIAHNSLNKKVAFVATLLNSKKTSNEQGISFDTTLLEKLVTVFDSFEDEGRTLDYVTIKQNLVFIAESLKPILAASSNSGSLGFFLENDFAEQLVTAATKSDLVDEIASPSGEVALPLGVLNIAPPPQSDVDLSGQQGTIEVIVN